MKCLVTRFTALSGVSQTQFAMVREGEAKRVWNNHADIAARSGPGARRGRLHRRVSVSAGPSPKSER